MTASQAAKSSGLKSLAEVSRTTKQSPQTLTNWHRDKPELFEVVLLGCMVIGGISDFTQRKQMVI